MNYIYYIWLSNRKDIDLSTERAGNYIGQGSNRLDNGQLYGRMLEHLRIAYGQQKGKIYGSEALIQEVGASDVFFGVYHAPNYGLDPQIFREMQAEGWNISDADDDARLDAAEILHIISHKGDLSGGNVATGGQGALTWRPDDVQWVKNLPPEWNISKLYTGDLSAVKINFHDTLGVALSKLWHPDQFLIMRAASLAIEGGILSNGQFLKDTIIAYFNSPSNAKKLIKDEVDKIIQRLNRDVFKRQVVKAEHIDVLTSIIEEKVLKWAKERIEIVATAQVLKELKQIFNPNNDRHISWAVHGLPNYFTGKEGDSNHVVSSTSFHIKRSEWASVIRGTKPKWYTDLMAHPIRVPAINTGSDEGLRKIVENCIYEIFLTHMSRCTKSIVDRKPKTSLKERIRDKYTAAGAHMKNYTIFYQYAIGKWEKEHQRTLSIIDNSTEEDRNLYTFEPDLTPTTWLYSWSDSFADKVLMHYGAEEIPSWTW